MKKNSWQKSKKQLIAVVTASLLPRKERRLPMADSLAIVGYVTPLDMRNSAALHPR